MYNITRNIKINSYDPFILYMLVIQNIEDTKCLSNHKVCNYSCILSVLNDEKPSNILLTSNSRRYPMLNFIIYFVINYVHYVAGSYLKKSACL